MQRKYPQKGKCTANESSKVLILKIKVNYFTSKNVFIQEQQRIAVQDMQLWQNHRQVWRTKERTIILQRKGEFGGSFHNIEPLEETGNSKCSGFSLSGLWLSLIGRAIARGGKNLPPSWRGIRAENIFLLEVQGRYLPIRGNQG